jgi:hypothetical protein
MFSFDTGFDSRLQNISTQLLWKLKQLEPVWEYKMLSVAGWGTTQHARRS